MIGRSNYFSYQGIRKVFTSLIGGLTGAFRLTSGSGGSLSLWERVGVRGYKIQSSSKIPTRLIAQAIVVGTDQTIICCFTSLIPIILLTTQNMLSLK